MWQGGHDDERIFNLRVAEQIKYALIVVASLPVMAIYPLVQKHFVKGVTVGAVKG